MSPVAYAIATTDPYYLLGIGFACGVVFAASFVLGLRGARRG